MRRAVGLVLALAGAVLLLFAGVGYTRGFLARDRAHARWETKVAYADSSAGALDAAAGSMFSARSLGEPVGRIVIPAVQLDEMVLEGVGDAQLRAGPGHVPETVLPGGQGNSVISAHRDSYFRSLGRLTLGDTVITETLAGRRSWVITARQIAEAGKPAILPTDDATLTLTTCWPIRFVGPAPDRLLLTAKPVE